MEIANPIYDVVFKYLMEDNDVAITFLSALTEMEIVSLLPLPQELVLEADGNRGRANLPLVRKLSIYRLDYSARIRSVDGGEKIVILEIQREKVQGQEMRFRKYLGKQFENGNFYKKAQTPGGRDYDIGIPILSIYFFGEGMQGFRDVPVVLIQHSAIARHTMQPLYGTNPFVDALFHKGIIVNVPYLGHDGRDDLETLLSIFSPLNKTTNPQIMRIQETKFMEKYQPILRRLKAAAQDRDVRNKMTAEDDFLEEMERYERNYEEMLHKMKEVGRKEEEIGRKEKEVGRKEEEIGRKEEEIGRKEEEIGRKEEEIGRKEEEIGRKEEEIGRKEEEIGRKEKEVGRKEEEIKHLEKEMLQREEEFRYKQNEIQQQKEKTIRLLLGLGIPREEISSTLNISREELDQY